MAEPLVYIVDDDGQVLTSVGFLLQTLKIRCRTFAGAEIFLDSVDSLEPGCIISDLNMPGMSGLQLQEELLKSSLDWPFILMSGQGDIPAVVQTVKKGAIEFLEKPFSEESLLAALHSGFHLLADRPRLLLEPISRALQDGKIGPHYQPKRNLKTGKVTGFEALLRGVDGDEHVQAEAIREAFDDARLCRALSERMLDRIVVDISQWTKAGVEFGQISFNAAPKDLEDPLYAQALLDRISNAGIDPARLQVEVVETVAFNPETHSVRDALETLSGGGVSVALDDFGTGYASLTHLRSLPVDAIKIDRSFVAALQEPSSQSIVRAIVGLGKGLGKEVVAEGVETLAQSTFLTEIGCDTAQGFLFGRAVPADEVPGLL